jgi:hypothetical protein
MSTSLWIGGVELAAEGLGGEQLNLLHSMDTPNPVYRSSACTKRTKPNGQLYRQQPYRLASSYSQNKNAFRTSEI